jgi:hypothetical protein
VRIFLRPPKKHFACASARGSDLVECMYVRECTGVFNLTIGRSRLYLFQQPPMYTSARRFFATPFVRAAIFALVWLVFSPITAKVAPNILTENRAADCSAVKLPPANDTVGEFLLKAAICHSP